MILHDWRDRGIAAEDEHGWHLTQAGAIYGTAILNATGHLTGINKTRYRPNYAPLTQSTWQELYSTGGTLATV